MVYVNLPIDTTASKRRLQEVSAFSVTISVVYKLLLFYFDSGMQAIKPTVATRQSDFHQARMAMHPA
jgi:hypothetical protein